MEIHQTCPKVTKKISQDEMKLMMCIAKRRRKAFVLDTLDAPDTCLKSNKWSWALAKKLEKKGT